MKYQCQIAVGIAVAIIAAEMTAIPPILTDIFTDITDILGIIFLGQIKLSFKSLFMVEMVFFGHDSDILVFYY